MILYKLGVRITVEIISNMKLTPTIPKKSAATKLFGFISPKREEKKNQHITQKIAVFNTGTTIEAIIEATMSFLFDISLYAKPAPTPAMVVLSRQVKTVATGLTVKKYEIVLGEIKTIIPQTSPKNPPTTGPYRIAPNAIGTKDKLIFAKAGLM